MTATPDRKERRATEGGLTKQGILAALGDNQDILDRYTVESITLFGSYATGRQTAQSDIDFLVEFEKPTYDNFVGLSRALEKLFHRKIELLTPEGLNSIRVPRVRESIRSTLAHGQAPRS